VCHAVLCLYCNLSFTHTISLSKTCFFSKQARSLSHTTFSLTYALKNAWIRVCLTNVKNMFGKNQTKYYTLMAIGLSADLHFLWSFVCHPSRDTVQIKCWVHHIKDTVNIVKEKCSCLLCTWLSAQFSPLLLLLWQLRLYFMGQKFQKHYVYNYALGLDFGFSMLLPSLVVLSTLIVC